MCKSRWFNTDMKFMVPLADLTPHRYDGNLRWLFVPNEGFSLMALKDIEVGEPLDTNYGHFDSYTFFMNRGFLPASPTYNFTEAKTRTMPGLFDTLNTIVTIPEKVFSKDAPWGP